MLTQRLSVMAISLLLGITASCTAVAPHGEADSQAAVQVEMAVEVESASEQQAQAEQKPTQQPAPSPEDKEQKALQKELAKLQLEYQLLLQRQKNETAKQELEKQKLALQTSLRAARQGVEMASLKAELEKLSAQAALSKVKQEQELSAMKTELAALQTQAQLYAARRANDKAPVLAKTDSLTAQNALLQQQIASIKIQLDKTNIEHQAQLAKAKRAVELADAKRAATTTVTTDIARHGEPFKNGELHISDRRIALNGGISMETADYITERIHFFNNQSAELPIFIVIDSSPGGSVMAGYRILKAMDASEAPIHVVVKSFAASMAAAITTLAEHSYAYPNAIILHHQMSSNMRGNLTQQKEQLENALEWAKRLANPIAEKMGVSPQRFTEMMYQNNSDGDWDEFADEAVKLKWVDHLVTEVREQGVVKHPDGKPVKPRITTFFGQEQVDSEGRSFVKLPRLDPFDHWFLYDPDNYYR